MNNNNILSEIKLFISCQNLPKMDTLTKSDPFVVVYEKNNQGYIEINRTETIENCENPSFVTQINVDYMFEIRQFFRFDIYDANSKSTKLSDHDYIGSYTLLLSKLITTKNSTIKTNILDKNNNAVKGENKNNSLLILKSEETSKNLDVAKLNISAKNLTYNKMSCLCCKTNALNAYIEFLSVTEDNKWVPVYRTESVEYDKNPCWKTFDLSVQMLCNGDYSRPIKVIIYNKVYNNEPILLGEITTDLKTIENGEESLLLKDGKGNTIELVSKGNEKLCNISKGYSLLEFITGGMEINLMVAIDFTLSNGDPTSPNSLHSINNGGALNEYQMAIKAIGDVLEPYDSDNNIPAWGFGASINGKVEHCFPLTLTDDPYVVGVNGILEAYQRAIYSVKLFGPTIFSNIIQSAIDITKNNNKNHQRLDSYSILLMITDGIITDLEATINIIVKTCEYPISIIIIGVGDADFSEMEILDADDVPLMDSSGIKLTRDIVQFIPFRKFRNSPMLLSKETLFEIPKQFGSYIRKFNVIPNKIGDVKNL